MNMNLSILESTTGLNLQGTVRPTVTVNPAPLKVEFYLDSSSTPIYIISTSPYVWVLDTTKISNGSHLIRAEAVYKTRRSKAQMAISVLNGSIPSPNTAFGVSTFGGQVSFLRRLVSRLTGFRSSTSK